MRNFFVAVLLVPGPRYSTGSPTGTKLIPDEGKCLTAYCTLAHLTLLKSCRGLWHAVSTVDALGTVSAGSTKPRTHLHHRDAQTADSLRIGQPWNQARVGRHIRRVCRFWSQALRGSHGQVTGISSDHVLQAGRHDDSMRRWHFMALSPLANECVDICEAVRHGTAKKSHNAPMYA